MSMYYDFTIDNKSVLEDIQGQTCAEVYDFLEQKFGVPTYQSYHVPAIELAQFFAERHDPEIDDFEGAGAGFKPNDNLYEESWMHFERGAAENLTDEEKINAYRNAKILFGEKINPTSELIITIS